jgi:hypothetical protein
MFRHLMQRLSRMVRGLRQRFQKTAPPSTAAGRHASRARGANANGHKPTTRPQRKRPVRIVKKT